MILIGSIQRFELEQLLERQLEADLSQMSTSAGAQGQTAMQPSQSTDDTSDIQVSPSHPEVCMDDDDDHMVW